jgi:16S rRNA (cytosine1402-N4)-methyltransferase
MELTTVMSGTPHHIPVMLEEVLSLLGSHSDEGAIVLDGTFGAGGYTRGLLEAHPAMRVVAVDRDPSAIKAGQSLGAEFQDRLTLVQGRFGDLADIANDQGVLGQLDGVVLDIGVSSMQIDEAPRGFSFRFDGPLDMRMEQSGVSAADLVNRAEEGELADIFYHYGEERRSRAIAKAIVATRTDQPITTTKILADLVANVIKGPPQAIHPATRVFQALRIAVNDELGELVRALEGAEKALKPGGVLVVVSFHSLEDRIVKRFLLERSGKMPSASRHMPTAMPALPGFELLTRKAMEAGPVETARNPRARSAHLRAGRRLFSPAQKCPPAVLGLLPSLSGMGGSS